MAVTGYGGLCVNGFSSHNLSFLCFQSLETITNEIEDLTKEDWDISNEIQKSDSENEILELTIATETLTILEIPDLLPLKLQGPL